MANTEDKKLAIDVLARIDKLEKGMAKAAGIVSKRTKEMDASVGKFTKSYESKMTGAFAKVNAAAGRLGIGGLLGALAGATVAGVVTGVADVAKGIAEIGDQAQRAGVSVEAFQELKYVAEQNRIGVDSLTDGLKELNIRADEFVLTGKGSGEEAFRRLGYSAEELKTKIKDTPALFGEIIGRLGSFEKAAQIRIADEVFGGTGGEKFVQLIDQGADGIRRTVKEARDLGVVMDASMVKKADEVDRKFNAIANSVGVTLKSAIVSAADSLAEFIDGFRDFQNQAGQTLQNSQSAIMAQKAGLGEQMRQLNSQGLEEFGESYVKEALKPLQDRMAALNEQEDRIIAELQNRSAFNPMNRSADREWKPPALPPASSSSTASAAERQALREREAVTDLIAELEREAAQLKMTDIEKARANALREAGSAATADERAKILALVDANYREAESQKARNVELEFQKDLVNGALSDMRTALEDGKLTWEDLGNVAVNVLNKIADRLQTMLVDQLFAKGFGGLFGSLTGVGGAVIGGVSGAGGSAVGKVAAPTVAKVMASAPRMPSLAGAKAAAAPAEMHVFIDDDGGLRGYVEKEGRRTEARVLMKSEAARRSYVRGEMSKDVNRQVRNPRRTG